MSDAAGEPGRDLGPAVVPVLDPDRQHAAERLAALIESAGESSGGEPSEGGAVTFRASIERRERAGHWLVGADRLGLRVDMLDGEIVSLHPERVDAAVAALDRLEPLLDLIESRTGWVVEPESTAATPADDALVIALAASRDGGAIARFSLAVPPALAESAMRAAEEGWSATPPDDRFGRVPLPCRLRATAAQLSIEDAQALAVGDMLVLDSAPWRGSLRVDPLGDTIVSFDPVAGALRGKHGGSERLSNGDASGLDGLREFRVPVDLRLPDQSATLSELASLRAGGTLPLGPLTAGLTVELSVAGRPIATGEIVRLGDRFAVVVDRVVDDASPAVDAEAIPGDLRDDA